MSGTAEVYHLAADSANAVIVNHAPELPIEQVCAVAEYRDYLRELAVRLENLTLRLTEQGRRLEQEKRASESCDYCGRPGAHPDGICPQCASGNEL